MPDKYLSASFFAEIESFANQKQTGTLILRTNVPSWKQQRISSFVLQQGHLVFANAQLLNNEQFCQVLGNKISPNTINAALLTAKARVSNVSSYQEFSSLPIRMKVFTWSDVVSFAEQKLIQNLEVFATYPGTIEYRAIKDFDLFTKDIPEAFSWSAIAQKIAQRRQKWQSLMPTIPSMDAVPQVNLDRLQKVGNPQVKKHLIETVDGQKNLLDIAARMGKDVLKVASTYSQWHQQGWIGFNPVSTGDRHLPVVLSVDDSPPSFKA